MQEFKVFIRIKPSKIRERFIRHKLIRVVLEDEDEDEDEEPIKESFLICFYLSFLFIGVWRNGVTFLGQEERGLYMDGL